MATFSYNIHHWQKNNTGRVIITLFHNSQQLKISTEIFVLKSDVTKTGKIKSQGIRDEIETIIQKYRKTIVRIGKEVNTIAIDDLRNILVTQSDINIDFVEFAKQHVADLKARGKSQHKNITAALNSITAFAGNKILFNHITADFLRKYEAWLRSSPGRRTPAKNTKKQKSIGIRGITLYIGIIRKLINEAKLIYNDEDRNIINITVNPFARYKLPIESPPDKRALTIDEIKIILSYQPDPVHKRMKLALDCYKLSFYMIGINAVDLYNASPGIENNIFTYNRAKTKDRRKDQARIQIRIEPETKQLFDYYTDKTKSRQFDFYKRYASSENFNHALRKGLKQLSEVLNIPKIDFYSARHTWATIAANDCRIDINTVHKALNHVNNDLNITYTYIKDDFTNIWEANRKVIDYLNSHIDFSV